MHHYSFVLLSAILPTTTSFSFSSKLSQSKYYKSSSSISTRKFVLKSSSSSSSSFVDFSSPSEWETFYREEEHAGEEGKIEGVEPGASATTAAAILETTHITEWHSSISLDDIASIVPSNGRCLLIGCGNSLLPDRILERQKNVPIVTPPLRSLVLLDTSPTCLDQLRQRLDTTTSTKSSSTATTQENENECNGLFDNHSKIKTNNSTTKIDYICGDATKLSTYFDTTTTTTIDDDNDNDNNKDDIDIDINDNGNLFDMIIDKGLTDAILCNEGWDGILEQLYTESAKILSKEGTGRYLLISYQLPSSTKDFIISIGEHVGWEWEFDYQLPAATLSSVIPPTMTPPAPSPPLTGHPRVSVAMATCKKRKVVDI